MDAILRIGYRVLNNAFILAFKNSINKGRKVQTGTFIFKTEGEQLLRIDY